MTLPPPGAGILRYNPHMRYVVRARVKPGCEAREYFRDARREARRWTLDVVRLSSWKKPYTPMKQKRARAKAE